MRFSLTILFIIDFIHAKHYTEIIDMQMNLDQISFYLQTIYISTMAWRFKTSKYKNAAPKVIKREVKIDLCCFIFKNLTQNINHLLHPY